MGVLVAAAGCGGGPGARAGADEVVWWVADRDGRVVVGLDADLLVRERLRAAHPVAVRALPDGAWVEECPDGTPLGRRRWRALRSVRDEGGRVSERGPARWQLGPARGEAPAGWEASAPEQEGRPPWARVLPELVVRLGPPHVARPDGRSRWLLVWPGAVLLARREREGWRAGPTQGGFAAAVDAALNRAGAPGTQR